MPKTRKNVKCPVFGAPCIFKDSVLPTYADVMKNYLFIRQSLLDASQNQAEPTLTHISTILLAEIKVIWAKSSIPIISDQQIMHLIRSYHEKFRKIKKPIKSRKSEVLLTKIAEFRQAAEGRLFDISACKCVNFLLCKCKTKVPFRERDFLADQRSGRKMVIGSIDVIATAQIERSLERKRTETVTKPGIITETAISIPNTFLIPEDHNLDDLNEIKDDPDFVSKVDYVKTCQAIPDTSQMRLTLPSLAQACDRTGVSDRSAAIIANAVLKDVGLISKEETSKIIDRSKIRRERKRARNTIKEQHNFDNNPFFAIYFDGRKDKTLVQTKEGDTFHRKTITEEHIALISEPGSKYFGHFEVSSGTAKNITTNVLQFLQKQMNLSDLVAIGCDGTAVNTGRHNGIIRNLEVETGKSLQWIICLLHGNELPLRHLIKKLDGETTGPTGYTGVIGKQLQSCEKLAIVSFKKINVIVPEVDPNILSTDQKYLLEISVAISNGVVSKSLAQKQPGKLAHSRWLTTANRILRLYVGTINPSEELKILTTYILKVYVTTWFSIKLKPDIKYGSLHLFNLIQRSRYLPSNLRQIVDKIIQVNGYFAHPENILLCMLGDERLHIRELGLRRILKCRTTHPQAVRTFQVPKINFEATDYTELIHWQAVAVTEPPITRKFSTEDLREMIAEIPEKINLFKMPCHTQAVERCVKLVTEASLAVCGSDARDGFIRNRILGRQILPKFDTKTDYFKADV